MGRQIVFYSVLLVANYQTAVNPFSRLVPYKGPRLEFGVSELHNKNGESQIMIFGGYDPYLYPRFLNTFEQYDAILNEWNFPGENLINKFNSFHPYSTCFSTASYRYSNARSHYSSTRLLENWFKNPSTRVLDTRRWIH